MRSIAYFIRLLSRNVHWILLAGLAGLAVALVPVLLQPPGYLSSVVICPGVASDVHAGPDIGEPDDPVPANNLTGNLIAILKSRETAEKTAIRLMAGQLMLSFPDSAICLPSTWEKLVGEVPPDLRRLVDSVLADRPETTSDVRDTAMPVVRFEKKPRVYVIRAGDSPVIVANKFGITLETLHSLNEPMPPFRGGRRIVVGMDSVAITWNIRDTVNQTPAVAEPDVDPFSGVDRELSKYERLVDVLQRYGSRNQDNFIHNALDKDDSFYSARKIGTVRIKRIRGSDLVRLTFRSPDPAVCRQTLKIMTDVAGRQLRSVSRRKAAGIASYYERRVTDARNLLDSLENSLMGYRLENRIIDFEVQFRALQDQKNRVDRDWYREVGRLSAAQTAAQLISRQFRNREPAVAQGNRNGNGMNPYRLDSSLLWGEWFEKTLEVAESEARVRNLTNRKREIQDEYERYAPIGSRLQFLEREIDRAQQDYQEQLSYFNRSVLLVKSAEQQDISVIDGPDYPSRSSWPDLLPWLLLVFLTGLVAGSLVVVAVDLVLWNLGYANRMEKLTRLEMFGMLPRVPERTIIASESSSPLVPWIGPVVSKIIRQRSERAKKAAGRPFIVFIASTREQEGKTSVAAALAGSMRNESHRVLFLKPEEPGGMGDFLRQFSDFRRVELNWDREYPVNDRFMESGNLRGWLDNFSIEPGDYDFVIIEVPALNTRHPARILSGGDLSLIVVRATRPWKRIDAETVSLYRSTAGHPVAGVLNFCRPKAVPGNLLN